MGGGEYQVVEYLVSYDPHHFKALFAPDAIDDHIAMYADEVFAIQD